MHTTLKHTYKLTLALTITLTLRFAELKLLIRQKIYDEFMKVSRLAPYHTVPLVPILLVIMRSVIRQAKYSNNCMRKRSMVVSH